MIRKILPLVPFSARKILVQALILSRLDYANVLYLGSPCSTIKKLQLAQNCAARLLMQAPYRESAKPLITYLHWLPVAEIIQFKALCITHKVMSFRAPPILSSIITPSLPRPLRSEKKHLSRSQSKHSAEWRTAIFRYLG